MDESFLRMRDFIMATESLDVSETATEEPEAIVESVSSDTMLLQDMADIVFKLRAFMESNDGDVSLGIEMGMQRAADMIENAIRRHTDGVQIG